jgi:hypothetical protein
MACNVRIGSLAIIHYGIVYGIVCTNAIMYGRNSGVAHGDMACDIFQMRIALHIAHV